MPRITDTLARLTAQHDQIEFLFDMVATLRDPDALAELSDVTAQHLAEEENVLYAMTSRLAAAVREELLAEHVAIRRCLSELVWRGVTDDEFAIRLDQLWTLLEGHAAYQEDELFVRFGDANGSVAA